MKTDSHWQKIGLFPHHGICVPLFSSLRTKRSCGIGEFFDLIPLIDWCKKVHFDCIQLLPLNDSGEDPSPYNPVSSCALNPIYLSLKDLGCSEDFDSLTQSDRVDWKAVLDQKIGWLRRYFTQTFKTLAATPAYRTFVEENAWLELYVNFKKEADFHRFLQFHCFAQMEKVHAYATQQGVFLKGDIPILLSPESADVWAQPDLFRLDLAAGAPPDYYNTKGQYWGFPLFNWEAMRHGGFSWWKRRLKVAEKLFHIYRIDHVVGFFRIWGIPKGAKPTEGSFIPPDHALWAPQGKELLEMMIDSTSMLPIAEDLGTIPPEVYPILKELGICGTKVLAWQKRDETYIPFNEYEPLSMTTLSTPDMPPLEMWWKTFPAEAVPFAHFMGWHYHPLLTTAQRFKILHAAHHTTSLFHINLLQEYLDLFPELAWPHSEQDRINIPGTLLPTNWTYRFKPYLEEITQHQGLSEAIQKIISP